MIVTVETRYSGKSAGVVIWNAPVEPYALLLGEAPARPDRWTGLSDARPLSGDVAIMLSRIAGAAPHVENLRRRVTPTTYRDVSFFLISSFFSTRNVLDEWPGYAGKGAAFPVEAARTSLKTIMTELPDQLPVIGLGARVRSLLGLSEFFEIDDAGERAVAAVPHPSGLNRLYNEESARHAAREILRETQRRSGSPTIVKTKTFPITGPGL